MQKVKIKELFISIQGEGPFVGYKQIFIRLCGCNLKCNYCDTDFDAKSSKEYTIEELSNFINQHKECHSISLTGGEPLLHVCFIEQISQKTQLPIYLETNATLWENLKKVIDCVEYISADIKLPSATGLKPNWESHDKFFEISKSKYLYMKAVFDANITKEEILKMCEFADKYDVELVLQPMMHKNTPSVSSAFMQTVLDKCLTMHKKTRLIPQVHKFINVE